MWRQARLPEAVKPAHSKSEDWLSHAMAVSGDVHSCSATTESFAVEEAHFVLVFRSWMLRIAIKNVEDVKRWRMRPSYTLPPQMTCLRSSVRKQAHPFLAEAVFNFILAYVICGCALWRTTMSSTTVAEHRFSFPSCALLVEQECRLEDRCVLYPVDC